MPGFLESLAHYEGSLDEAKTEVVANVRGGIARFERAELHFKNGERQMIYATGTYGQKRVNPGLLYFERAPTKNTPENEIRSMLRTMPSQSIERAQFLMDDR